MLILAILTTKRYPCKYLALFLMDPERAVDALRYLDRFSDPTNTPTQERLTGINNNNTIDKQPLRSVLRSR
jgi:hypothetical protein